MAKQPSEMDAREQAVAALEAAKTFDDPFEFNAFASPEYFKLGAADIVSIYRQAHGLDLRTGDPLRPDLQPHEIVSTVNSGTVRVKGEPIADAGTAIAQSGINKD